MNTELQKHCAWLTGIGSVWKIKGVGLRWNEKKVETELGRQK
jgi:hypothetical protein